MASKSALRMYAEPASNHAQLTMFVIGLKQIPCEMLSMDWLDRPKELTDINPFKKVPTLIDGDFGMYESRAICRYLDKRFPDKTPQLIPSDIHDYAKMEQWCSVEAHYYEPEMVKLIRQRVWGPLFRGAIPDEAICTEQVKKLVPIMEIINDQLGKTTYFVGSKLSIADIVFTPLTQHLTNTPEKSQLFDPYPNIVRWWSLISALPAWQHVQAEVKRNQEGMDKKIELWRESEKKKAKIDAADQTTDTK